MSDDRSSERVEARRRGRLSYRLRHVVRRLLTDASRGMAREEFLRRACEALAELSGCDAVEIRIVEAATATALCARASLTRTGDAKAQVCRWGDGSAPSQPAADALILPEPLLEGLLNERIDAALPYRTRSGTFWTADSARPILLRDTARPGTERHTVIVGGAFQSFAVFPVPVDARARAALVMGSHRRGFFNPESIVIYETLATALGGALANQGAQRAARQRLRAVECLCRVMEDALEPHGGVGPLLDETVRILASAFDPEPRAVRITFDNVAYGAAGREEDGVVESSDIVVDGTRRGRVEVFRAPTASDRDGDPEVTGNVGLVDEIGRKLGRIIGLRERASGRAQGQGERG